MKKNIYNYLEKRKFLLVVENSEGNRSGANQKLKSRISKDIAGFQRGAGYQRLGVRPCQVDSVQLTVYRCPCHPPPNFQRAASMI